MLNKNNTNKRVFLYNGSVNNMCDKVRLIRKFLDSARFGRVPSVSYYIHYHRYVSCTWSHDVLSLTKYYTVPDVIL